MASVTCTGISTANGKVRISFGKRTYEFGSLDDVRNHVANALSKDTLEAIFLALAVSRQPVLNNPNLLVGRSVNVDFAVNNWGTIS